MNKLWVLIAAFTLAACGSDDPMRQGQADEDYDYAVEVAGEYEGNFSGSYSNAPSNNFGELGFAIVTKVEDDEVRINMQQGSRFTAILDNALERPDIVEIHSGQGRFEGAEEIEGFFNVQDSVISYTVNGTYSEGGTYEITFEGTRID